MQIVDSFVKKGDLVVLVTPIDESAPKGRIILPQQNVLRNLLDIGAVTLVVQVEELKSVIETFGEKISVVITDSQVFGEVSKIIPECMPLTSFSILFASSITGFGNSYGKLYSFIIDNISTPATFILPITSIIFPSGFFPSFSGLVICTITFSLSFAPLNCFFDIIFLEY